MNSMNNFSWPLCGEGVRLITSRRRSFNRLVPLGLVLLIVLGAVAICLAGSGADQAPLRIVGNQHHIPFEFLDSNGEPKGIIVDVWDIWSKQTEIPIRYELQSINEAYHQVLAGTADIVSGMTPSADYKDLFDFSIPYLDIEYFIFHHHRLDDVQNIEDLYPYRIGVVSGDFAELLLKEHQLALNLIPFQNASLLIQAAYQEKILIFVGNIPEMLFHLAGTGEAWRFQLARTPIATLHLCAAVKKGNHLLLEKINIGFSAISPHERHKASRQWSGSAVGYKLPWPFISLAILLIVSIVLALIIWFWNYQLSQKVALAIGDLKNKHQQLEESEKALRHNEEKYRALYAESKRAEDLYRSLLNSSPDAIIIYDIGGLPTFVNPAFKRIFGWDFQEIKHARIPFMPETEQEKITTIIGALIRQRTSCHGFETKRYTKSGALIDVSISASCYHDHEGHALGILSVIRDISVTKKLESQLRQSQKMEAIGALAGGVAHDFNNILSAIMGYTELAIRQTEQAHPLYSYLQQIDLACNRAVELVRQILSFSRQGEIEPRPVQISLIIKEVLKLIRASLPSTIGIRQRLTNENSIVNADPTQLHQVMINLCTNAGHAMREKGGVLEVSLDAELLTEAQTMMPAEVSPGAYVHLTVSDTGHGMDAKTMERIFDPYFTTKRKGDGTGLGLAVVQGIVSAHGGFVTVSSQIGSGSSFHVFLPAMDLPEAQPSDVAPQAPAEGKERILFVDDEETILEIGKEILSHFGYEVITTAKSVTALSLFQKNPADFDVVVSDMTMPQMTGAELARRLLEIRPEIPIIICTGYSDALDKALAKDIGIREFMLKPVNYQELAQIIRKLLDSEKKPIQNRSC